MNPSSRRESSNFGPIFPILPSYKASGELDFDFIASYVRFLETNGARSVMTTAGTSQFNLLSTQEILDLNACVGDNFSGRLILGAPPMAEMRLMPFLATTLKSYPDAELLLSYPERYYCVKEIVDFFQRAASGCAAPLHIHGLPLRAAQGGWQDYTATMISEILFLAPNVVGMKEECSTYETGFKLCSALSRFSSFELIVAGGSMRRFLLLHAAGAQSFLVGIGSLFPSVEIAFARHIQTDEFRNAVRIIAEIETPAFEVFMNLGWHKALRYAAKRASLIATGERLPMAGPDVEAKRLLDETLIAIEAKISDLSREGLL